MFLTLLCLLEAAEDVDNQEELTLDDNQYPQLPDTISDLSLCHQKAILRQFVAKSRHVTLCLSWSHAGHFGCMPLPRSKQVKQAKPAPERPETQKDKGDKLKDAMQWLCVDPENRKILQAEWKFEVPYHTVHFHLFGLHKPAKLAQEKSQMLTCNEEQILVFVLFTVVHTLSPYYN